MAARLPAGEVTVDDHRLDVARTAAYARVCGFPVRDAVPATWLHVATFGLQSRILRSKEFPFSLAGLVHVSNDMTLHRPVGVSERLRMAVVAANLQPHRRGATFELRGRIHADGELVWEGASTYLSTKADVPGEAPEAERLAMPDGVPSQLWRLPADLGRQYARVSGDWNPIHLHPLPAKLFGFPRAIIHGMWTHARALAAYGGALPEAYRVRVQFTKPILLPGKVGFVAADDAFAVVGGDGKPRLVGALTRVAHRA